MKKPGTQNGKVTQSLHDRQGLSVQIVESKLKELGEMIGEKVEKSTRQRKICV
jgi:hypothetical protein